MSQSWREPSQYLQDRLDAHAARNTPGNRSRTRGGRQSTKGYADVSDDGSAGQATPTAPSSFTAERENGRSRRSSTAGTHGTNTPRSGGAKEQSEHINRLQNENYNMKEKIYYLGRKLQGMDSQEQRLLEQEREIASMQTHCDDLMAEKAEMKGVVGEALEEIKLMREAVDQAVSRIYELELENKEMKAMLEEARHQRMVPTGQDSRRKSSSRYRDTATKPSRDGSSRRPARDAVSNDVANRLASLAQTRDDQYLPSFITHKEPSTAALRRMYIEGDQIIRPIPSQATLQDKTAEDFEDPHVALISPHFSELSDADDVDREVRGSDGGHTPRSLERHGSQDADSPQSSVARTNQWVEESGASSSSQRSRARPYRSRTNNYPSIGEALQSAPEDDPFTAPRPRVQQQLSHDNSKQSRTPPATGMPGFGASMFPPTPDTMATRPSNTSTSSFVTDRYATMYHSHRVAHPQVPEYKPVPQRPYQSRPPRDIMPLQLHRYDDRSPERDALGRDVYSSDSSSSPEMPRKDGFFPTVSLAGSTAIDAESTRDHNLTSQSSRERALNSGPLQPAQARRPQGSHTLQDSRQQSWQYDGGIDARTLSSRSNQSGTLSNPSLTQSPRSSRSQGVESGVPLVSAHQTPPLEPLSPSSAKSSDKEKHPRSTLRQRLNRLRRTSNASESTPTGTPTNGNRRSNSISQRFGFRRNSTTSQATPITARFDGASAAGFSQAVNATAPGSVAAGAQRQSQPQQQQQQSHTTPQPPARSPSVRSPNSRPPVQPLMSSSSIPARTKGASVDAVPLVGEFGELRAPMTAGTKSISTRSRTGSKSGPPGTPLVETATIAFATRGREGTAGSKARGVLRSLSRSRTDGVQRTLGAGRG